MKMSQATSAVAHRALSGWKTYAVIRFGEIGKHSRPTELLHMEGTEDHVLEMMGLAGWKLERKIEISGTIWFSFERY